MFVIHQIVGVVTDPMALVLVGLALALILKKRWLIGVALALGWVLAMPVTSGLITKWLESAYPVMRAEEMPEADAILVLGGGIGRPKEPCSYPYADLSDAADRVWHAARLYKAGKAPRIYCTNREVSKSTPPFLMDLGVPREAIVPLDGPRNTEEEAKRILGALKAPRLLLVTSASHMRRAELIFKKYAPEITVIPAATDYHSIESDEPEFDIRRYLPSVSGAMQMSAVLHELLGIVRYKLF